MELNPGGIHQFAQFTYIFIQILNVTILHLEQQGIGFSDYFCRKDIVAQVRGAAEYGTHHLCHFVSPCLVHHRSPQHTFLDHIHPKAVPHQGIHTYIFRILADSHILGHKPCPESHLVIMGENHVRSPSVHKILLERFTGAVSCPVGFNHIELQPGFVHSPGKTAMPFRSRSACNNTPDFQNFGRGRSYLSHILPSPIAKFHIVSSHKSRIFVRIDFSVHEYDRYSPVIGLLYHRSNGFSFVG